MKRRAEKSKTAGISDQAVQAKTGKAWPEWFSVLDKAGAGKMTHQEMAKYLHQKLKVSAWWSQMVTVGYEQAHGKRRAHQTPSGYQVSVSKTIGVSVSKLFRAWQVEKVRSQWLRPNSLVIRKATADKSLRITWGDKKTSLEVNFYSKDTGKTQVVVQHTKLHDSKAVERTRRYWSKALDKLKKTLEK